MALIVDCNGVSSAEEFWDRYEISIGAENASWFGRNLDALWDALEGEGPGCPLATHLTFKDADKLSDLKTRSGDSFLEALREIAANVSRIKVKLT